MNIAPDDLLKQLYDIKGLDDIGWWPLAPGWWAMIILAFVIAGILYWRRWTYFRSWKGDAWLAFAALDSQLSGGNTQDIAASLSALLRRVAMRSSSRADCAGLEGADWLRWLSAHDPGKFDWAARGSLLVEAPYAPPGQDISPETLKVLIHAAKRWVK
jgi:hypothetical protein